MIFFRRQTPEEAWRSNFKGNHFRKAMDAIGLGYDNSACRTIGKYKFNRCERRDLMQKACLCGNTVVLACLFKKYAFDVSESYNSDRVFILSLLEYAAQRGDKDIWNAIARQNSENDTPMLSQEDLLGAAVKACSRDMLLHALENPYGHADVKATELVAVSLIADEDLFEVLMADRRIADLFPADLNRALVKAVEADAAYKVRAFIERGASVTYGNNAAFRTALEKRNEDVIAAFLENGFAPEAHASAIRQAVAAGELRASLFDRNGVPMDFTQPSPTPPGAEIGASASVWSETIDLGDLKITTVFNFAVGQQTVVTERQANMAAVVRDFADIDPDVVAEAARKLKAAAPSALLPEIFLVHKPKVQRLAREGRG